MMIVLTPWLPIAVLLGGVLALILIGIPTRFRASGPIAAAVAALSGAAVIALGDRLPVIYTVSDWRPVTLLSTPVSFRLDGLAWVLGVGLMLLASGSLLTGLSRPGGHRAQLRAFILLMVAAGLGALFAGNLLTVCLAWTAFDFLFLAVMLFNVERDHAGEYTVFSITLNGAATLLLWIVALSIYVEGGSLYLHLAEFTGLQGTLVVLAAIFRLGLYPLHLWLPAEVELRPGLGALLHILPALLGVTLLARLALIGTTMATLAGPLNIAGAVALVVGAVLAWGQDDYRHALTFVILFETGLIVLAGVWLGNSAPLFLVSEGLGMVLAIGLLFLARGYDGRAPWAVMPTGVAVGALVGLPGTVGFVSRALLYVRWVEAGQWPLLLLAVASGAVMAATLVRWLRRPAPESFPDIPVLAATTVLGELLLSIPLIVFGFTPDRLADLLVLERRLTLGDLLGNSGVLVWGALLVTWGLAAVLVWRDAELHAVRGQARPWLTAALNLRWFYRLVLVGFGVVAGLVRMVAGLLEGEGAWLWTMIVLLLAWLYLKPI